MPQENTQNINIYFGHNNMGFGESNTGGPLKRHWNLNGNSNDNSGNGKNGTDTNITYGTANGKLGQGALFDGTSSKIVIGDDDNFTFPAGGGGFTVSLWTNTTTTNTADRGRVSKDTASNRERAIVSASGPSIYYINRFVFDQTTGKYVGRALNAYTLLRNTGRHLLTCTYDGGTTCASCKTYIDGNRVDTTDYTNGNITTMRSTASPLCISYRYNTYYYKGKMDEVIIEAGVWTQQQIQKYYTMTKGRFAIT